jgi:5-methylcytosine-specific restriction endonuclease McrA
LHCDHRVPYSAGGKTVPENLVTACRDCNAGKSAGLL